MNYFTTVPQGTLRGGRRVALRSSESLPDWYVGFSPRNGQNAAVEGTWEDWVTLAKAILAEDEARKAQREGEK